MSGCTTKRRRESVAAPCSRDAPFATSPVLDRGGRRPIDPRQPHAAASRWADYATGPPIGHAHGMHQTLASHSLIFQRPAVHSHCLLCGVEHVIEPGNKLAKPSRYDQCAE